MMPRIQTATIFISAPGIWYAGLKKGKRITRLSPFMGSSEQVDAWLIGQGYKPNNAGTYTPKGNEQ